jgi:hypothetical protein
MGSRTCNSGTWGACVPDGSMTTQAVPKPSRYRLLALGSTQACGSLNVCDPYCNDFTDTPTGVDAGAGLTTRDGGLQLTGTLTATSVACMGLSIAPLTPTLTVNSITLGTGGTTITAFSPSSLTFTPTFTPAGCAPAATQPLWTIDRYDIATINAMGVLTMATPYAATITVTAYAGSLTATTTATVNVDVTNTAYSVTNCTAAFPSVCTTSSTIPTVAVSAFCSNTSVLPCAASNVAPGTADSGAPSIIYPYANTVFPLGLNAPLIQWAATTTATGANDAVKVGVRSPSSGAAPYFKWGSVAPENSSIYLSPTTPPSVPLAAGMRRDIPQAIWSAFEQSTQDAAVHDGYVTVQRYRSGALLNETKNKVVFATGQLKGTLYYQSYGTNLIQNFPNNTCPGSNCTYSPQNYGSAERFGAATLSLTPGATFPTVVVGSTPAIGSTPSGCRVCHSASADGTTLTTTVHDPPSPATGDSVTLKFLLGVDSPSAYTPIPTPLAYSNKVGWAAIYKDGSFLFGSTGPTNVYNGAASSPYPGGLEGSAGDIPNRLYSLATATLGNDISPGTMFPAYIPAAFRAALPAFSPDGTLIAFNHYAGNVTNGTTYTADKRSLAVMNFAVASKTFSNFKQVVTEPSTACSAAADRANPQVYQSSDSPAVNITDPCADLWPSFLPGNEGILFERQVVNNTRISTAGNQSDFAGTRAGCSTKTSACSNSGARSELWWVSLSTLTRHRLDNANGTTAAGVNYLPTLATDPTGIAASHTAANEPVLNYSPNVTNSAVGGYYWAAFTSRRMYGNVATMNPWWSDPRAQPLGGQYGAVPKKIWISAIDQSPASGGDPSHPAFYLPGQELLGGNEKAIWVGSACTAAGATCQTTLDCCQTTPTTCTLDTPVASPPTHHCVANSAVACVADGAACSKDANCCNFATGSRCAGGTCAQPPKVPVYSSASYTRDFVASCPSGTFPEWGLVEWEASVPTGGSIVFSAVTSATTAGLTTATPVVSVATATPANSSLTMFTPSANTIQSLLLTNGSTSQINLRLTIQVNPSTDKFSTPSLTNWRVRYDCPPAE